MEFPRAIARFLLKVTSGFGLLPTLGRLIFGPRLTAMAGLTFKAAFRFRLVPTLAVLLLGIVIGLPLVIKDDGTARGLTQLLLTYTLGVITALLGVSTLWLACGSLARDIEECQLQVVAAKPIHRWQIWVGKLLGIMLVNALLLGLSGVAVYRLILWRAGKLDAKQQTVLMSEVLVARGSAKEPVRNYEEDTESIFQEQNRKTPNTSVDPEAARKQISERLKAMDQVVEPKYRRRWEIPLGANAKARLKDQPVYLRFKFFAPQALRDKSFAAAWYVGPPDKPGVRMYPMKVAAETFHEFPVAAELIGEDGVLTVEFWNHNEISLFFPLEDGMEMLYREGGFGLNFFRALLIVFLWLTLLAVIGLTAASQLSFPVAAFFSLGILAIGLSSGTLATVVEQGTIMGADHETGKPFSSSLDSVLVPVMTVMLRTISLVESFSPIESLTNGRTISWRELGRAFAQIGLLMSGGIGLIGVGLLYRRELATAQANQ